MTAQRHLKSVSQQAEVTENRSVPEKFAACRSWGHAWDFTTVVRKGQDYIQGLRCVRCETERFTAINMRTGESHGNSYSYAKGYQVTGGALTPKERAALRLGEVKRHQAAIRAHLRQQKKA